MTSTATRKVLLSAAILISLAAPAVWGQDDCPDCLFMGCHTPVISPPSNLWGELQPADAVLPGERDSSHQSNFGVLERIPRWLALDPVEDGSGRWLMAVTNFRVQTWSLATPDNPTDVGDVPLSATAIDVDITGHTPGVFLDIEAPPNNSNLVVIAGDNGAGTLVFDTTNKIQPKLLYQHLKFDARRVHTARLGGRDYAFVAGNLALRGLRLYDLTSASALNTANPCKDNNVCPAVHKGAIGTFQSAMGVDGAGNFVVVGLRPNGGPGGFIVYDVTNPLAPVQVMAGAPGRHEPDRKRRQIHATGNADRGARRAQR